MAFTLQELAQGLHLAEGFVNTQAIAEAVQTLAASQLAALPKTVATQVDAVAKDVTEVVPIAEAVTPTGPLQTLEKDLVEVAQFIESKLGGS